MHPCVPHFTEHAQQFALLAVAVDTRERSADFHALFTHPARAVKVVRKRGQRYIHGLRRNARHLVRNLRERTHLDRIAPERLRGQRTSLRSEIVPAAHRRPAALLHKAVQRIPSQRIEP